MATYYEQAQVVFERLGNQHELANTINGLAEVARYAGTIEHAPHAFELDDHHRFVTGKPALVCGNTAAMLERTRYAPHFEVDGTRAVHFGLFDCSSVAGATDGGTSDGASACC